MRPRRPAGALLRTAVVPLVALAMASCASAAAHEPPRTMSAGPEDTVSRAAIGAELSITASVQRVIVADAFVIVDGDLPVRGLLVFGTVPGALQPTDLVSVRGRIARFDFATFAPRFALSEAQRYQQFNGGKVLIAEQIRSYA
jgi:hypothetical protein